MRAPTKNGVALSIVIPARNDAAALGLTLDHLGRLGRREHM